jgi:hypothetical protein
MNELERSTDVTNDTVRSTRRKRNTPSNQFIRLFDAAAHAHAATAAAALVLCCLCPLSISYHTACFGLPQPCVVVVIPCTLAGKQKRAEKLRRRCEKREEALSPTNMPWSIHLLASTVGNALRGFVGQLTGDSEQQNHAATAGRHQDDSAKRSRKRPADDDVQQSRKRPAVGSPGDATSNGRNRCVPLIPTPAVCSR